MRRTRWTWPRPTIPSASAEFERTPAVLRSRRGLAPAATVQPDQHRQRLDPAVAAGGVHDRKLERAGRLRRSCRCRCGTPCRAGRSRHPVDLLAAKIKLSGGNANNLDALRTQLLPWEILQGLKMDINRPFGAGAFSMNPAYQGQSSLGRTARSSPTSPGMSKEHVPQITTAGKPPVTAPFNYSADGGVVSQRARFAGGPPVVCPASLRPGPGAGRHGRPPGGLSEDESDRDSAVDADVSRMIAQWAVNVVAYRDHNGIMIPFPYDPNPVQRQRLEPRPNTPSTRSGAASGPNC